MRYRANVEVRLKQSHSDPEGETTAKSLRDLRYAVEQVRVVKVFELVFEADSLLGARELVDEMCNRLLANPVKDDYQYDVVEAE